jgi:hypothetical protein
MVHVLVFASLQAWFLVELILKNTQVSKVVVKLLLF